MSLALGPRAGTLGRVQATSPLSSALAKLHHFVLTSHERPHDEPSLGEAIDAWFAGSSRAVLEWEHTSFMGYLAHGHADAHGVRMLDRFLGAARADLSKDEREALSVVRARAYVSLFEVVHVRVDAGFELLDRVSGEQLFVREERGTHSAVEGDRLLAWLVQVDDHLELLGPVCHVASPHVAVVDAAIAEGRRRHFTALQRGVPWAALPAVHRALREAVRDYAPTLEHQSGEPVLVCRAIYEIKAADTVREMLGTCPDLTASSAGRFFLGSESDRGRPDRLAEVELRTVRVSVKTLSRSRLAEAKGVVERLLGKLAKHRVDRFEDPLGRPLATGEEASSRSRPVADRVVLASDVEASIAGFHRQLDAHIRGALPEAPAEEGAETPSATEEVPRAHPPEIDPVARLHRLPPAGHEVMQALVPGLRELVRDVSARLRRASGAENRTLTQHEIGALPDVERFLLHHARSLLAKEWEPSDALADADYLAAHVIPMLNHALHGRKTFWVDEALAWMLAETDLDVVGRSLRLPFPTCAFMFTDRGTLEIAESLLGQETECSLRGRTLRSVSAYVTRERETAEDEPQIMSMTFLFDAEGDKWPYLVSRDLFVEPDQHLDGILDSRVPSVSTETRDPIFLAPELKKLVHLVINAILFATSAHLEPILLSSKLRRLEQTMTGKGQRKREPLARQIAGLRGACSSEDVYHLPGHIEISKIKRLRELPRTESGRSLMKRFMVRGHWRRPNPDWQDQRLRWIEPYWKGPEIAAAIEREYRLKP